MNIQGVSLKGTDEDTVIRVFTIFDYAEEQNVDRTGLFDPFEGCVRSGGAEFPKDFCGSDLSLPQIRQNGGTKDPRGGSDETYTEEKGEIGDEEGI